MEERTLSMDYAPGDVLSGNPYIQEQVMKMISDPDPKIRAAGRLLATEAQTKFLDWFTEEVRRGEVEPTDLFIILTTTLGNVAANLINLIMKEGEDERNMQLVNEAIRYAMAKTLSEARKRTEELRTEAAQNV